MKLLLLLILVGCAAEDDQDTASAEEELSIAKVDRINTISYAPNSYVIGNAYPDWTDLIQGGPQFARGPGNVNGASYRWG